jgi:hypothetical protein
VAGIDGGNKAVSIGVLEATVHLLDFQHAALGVPSDVSPAGLEHTIGLLAKMTHQWTSSSSRPADARSRCSVLP